MNPFTSAFTTAGLILAAGSKITMSMLNNIVNNTGFNWVGGRHPMRESLGIWAITVSDLEGFASTSNRNPEPGSPIRETIPFTSRHQGVVKFSGSETYEVFATARSSIQIQHSSVRADADDNDFVLENLLSIDIVEKTPDSFTIQFDLPRPSTFGLLTHLDISWFAKGW